MASPHAFISGKGIYQDDLYVMLVALATNFNTMCDELTNDTSGTFNTTAYDVTLNMYDKNVTDGIDSAAGTGSGLSQAIVHDFLKDYIDKWNTLMTALNGTNLTAANYDPDVLITDTFVAVDAAGSTGTRNITATGMYQGDLVYTLNHILTQLAACTVKLDNDGLCSGYATAYDITDTIDTGGT